MIQEPGFRPVESRELPDHLERPAGQTSDADGTRFRLGSCLLSDPGSTGPRCHTWGLDEDVCEFVARVSKGEPLAAFVVTVAGLALLLARYSGQRSVRVGTPRLASSGPGADDRFPVSLSFDVDGSLPVREFIRQSQRTLSSAYTHDGAGSLAPPDEVSPTDVGVLQEGVHGPATSECTPNFLFLIRGREVTLHDARGILSEPAGSRLGEHLNRVLRQMKSLDRPLSDIELLPAQDATAQAERLSRGARTPNYLGESLSALFQAQAARSASTTAVVSGERQLTYGELSSAVDRLAHYLRHEMGVSRGDRVAVLCDRSELAVVALLGVLAAGAVYVPLSARQPSDRIRQVLADARVRAALFHSTCWDLLLDCVELPMFALDLQMEGLADPLPGDETEVGPDDLAAIIYTSGTEGRPKGVMLEHRALANVALDHVSALGMTPVDRYLQFMAPSFDGSLLDTFTALLCGATLVMVSDEVLQSLAAFHDYIERQEVTIFTITPAYLGLLEPARLRKVRAIVSAAEAANPALAGTHLRERDFYNGYGPTEACVNASLHQLERGRHYDVVPIGRPGANKELYVLDACRRPLPPGVVGEIAIGGPALSRGYWDDSSQTEAKFVPSPFDEGGRLYLTGDLGAWNDRGELCYRGRKDSQVKVRGFRVELGEVQHCLLRGPAVRDAAVVHDETRNRLVAFVVPNPGFEERSLWSELRRRLPDFMIPASLLCVEALPLTVHGKVDRKALLERHAEGAPELPASAPSDGLETALLALWREVLVAPEAGVETDFFQAGGDSIRVVQAVHLALQRGMVLSIPDVLRHRTVRALAEFLRSRVGEGPAHGPVAVETVAATPEERAELRVPAEDVFLVSAMQQDMLDRYAEPEWAAHDVYHCQASWQLSDPELSLTAMRQALRGVERRHPCLRTAFYRSARTRRTVQFIHPPGGATARERDLGDREPEEQADAVKRLLEADRAEKYEPGISAAPFSRFYLLRLSETRCQLVLSAHHAVIDGWSAVEIENDLFRFYDAYKRGAPPNEELRPLDGYREFVAIEAEVRNSEAANRFWAAQLARAVPAPLRRAALQEAEDAFGTRSRLLSSEQSGALVACAVDRNISLKAVCFTAFLEAIHSQLAEPELTIALVANGRSERMTDPLRTAGLFWNIVPYTSSTLDGPPDVATVAQRLREMEAHLGYPVGSLLAGRDEELFAACFNFVHFHNAGAPAGTLAVTGFSAHDRFHYPLTLVISVDDEPDGPRIELRAEHHQAYFSDADIDRLLARFEQCVTVLAADDRPAH